MTQMVQRFRSSLLAGFLMLLPLLVTVYLVQLVFGLVDKVVGGWLTRLLIVTGLAFPEGDVVWFLGIPFHGRVPVVGFALIILIFLLMGALSRTVLGRHVFRGMERAFGLVPVVRGIYKTVQQISQAFLHERTTFKQVVLVEYPRKGVYTVGFLTGESQGDLLPHDDRPFVNVYLPKSPNPTNGWLALVPKDDVTFVDMSVEDGLKFVISGGVVAPRTIPAAAVTTIEQGKREEEP